MQQPRTRDRTMRLVLAASLVCSSRAFLPPTGPTRARWSLRGSTVDEVAETTERKVLWQPSPEQIEASAMRAFQQSVGVEGGYEELWKWSVENSDEFWQKLMEFTNVEYSGSMEPAKEGDAMPDVTYFPNVQLNFAENLLRHAAPGSPLENAEAVVSISESRGEDKRWTFAELRDDAARVRAALGALGVTAADACGAYMPNVGETIVEMLGATSTGATWSSCSPDFGARAVADRFGQIGPKVLFVADGFVSAGKTTSVLDKVEELVLALPTLERVVVLRLVTPPGEPIPWSSDAVAALAVEYDAFLEAGSASATALGLAAPAMAYDRVPFTHPQFVLYSSGTTGLPKSIAHGGGNTLLQHAKELVLHSDLRPEDRMLFYTTCGWMMWNWMVSSLFAGATTVVFDGFAAYPKLTSPWDLMERERITHMGTSPRFFQACRSRVRPKESHDMAALRVIFSTGSPLSPEDYAYVYDKVKTDVMLASISGGTDICSCFALGNPMLPVRQGELQAFGLGLDACALDRETKRPVVGEKAELVCRRPFVAAPVCFFGDDDAKTKYRKAYFEEGDGVWYHGDLVEMTGSVGESGGLVIHGRSDTTLKPGGVRIGTAEVYRFAECVAAVEDSLVIGEQMKVGKRKGDVRIVLFVKLADGRELDADLEKEIRESIRSGASDAHVPALIKQVQAIPYTRSGKKVELAVRDLIDGTEPKNVGALQQADALDEYRKFGAEGL